jgi:hypothetical protein
MVTVRVTVRGRVRVWVRVRVSTAHQPQPDEPNPNTAESMVKNAHRTTVPTHPFVFVALPLTQPPHWRKTKRSTKKRPRRRRIN